MSLLDRKLAKLKISAYSDRNLKNKIGSIKAMYNPDSLRLSYKTNYSANEFINSTVQSNDYSVTLPEDLELDLIFDARMPGNNKSIEKQLSRLQELCYAIDPSRGEPHFLRVSWGNVRWAGQGYFAGRMRSLSFNYTLFDRDATPLRATANLVLIADRSIELQKSQQRLKSPPVAVLNVPAGGGGLPLIAATASTVLVGGISYLSLAWNNDLDSLHDILPGDTLVAPAQEEGTA